MRTSDYPSSNPFNAIVADRHESTAEPIALVAWGLALVIAVFSYYVYVINEQVNRAETLRQALLLQKATPASVDKFLTTSAVVNVAGYRSHPGVQAKARQDLMVTAVSRP